MIMTSGSVATSIVLCTMLAGENPWVTFVNETGQRLVASDERGVADVAERDLAFGDVDQDGDIDIVIARKTDVSSPCSNSLLCQNQLLINEGKAEGRPFDGIFVDRTAEFVTAADDGGDGFLDITNDRDIKLVDVNGDGWLDIITAPAVSDDQPKTISHPRIYINLGESAGEWQGFHYEEGRFPQLATIPEGNEVAPRFTSVSFGDIDGDGDMDLYFTDHDNGVSSPVEPSDADLNDRLLLNDGNGYFSDSLETRMTSQMLLSAFAAASSIADMNNDGAADIVKCTTLQTPQRVSIAYNDPNNPGFFNHLDVIYTFAPYHVGTTDLNNDGRMDIVVTDDGDDRYLINTGNDVFGRAEFTTLDFGGVTDDGFGGNQAYADLDLDGNQDVIIADVDPDFDGCSRRMHIYRNQGDGPLVTIDEEGGQMPWMPNGTHDVAVFDIDDDGLLDMFISTCDGNEIWINDFTTLEIDVQGNLPELLEPNQAEVLAIQVNELGGSPLDQDSVTLHYAIGNGPFTAVTMSPAGGNAFEATIPGLGCLQGVDYYFSAALENGQSTTLPDDAPFEAFHVDAADSFTTVFNDSLEADVSGWTVLANFGLTSGGWEVADPNGTISGVGPLAPENDATPGEGTMCFVTGNGVQGESASNNDVDGGAAILITPPLNLEDKDGVIEYAYWFETLNGTPDVLTVEITNNNGATWHPVRIYTEPEAAWRKDSFRVTSFVPPSTEVQLRFSISDIPNDSLTEAGIDDIVVQRLECDVDPNVKAIGPRYVSVSTTDMTGALAILFNGYTTQSSSNDTGCVSAYVQADGTLGANPVYQDAATWGPTVLVRGADILPSESYYIRFETNNGGETAQVGGSIVGIFQWGDINENWSTNFEDILLAVQAFQKNYDSVSLEQADLAPCLPNGEVNFEDIFAAVKAFQGINFIAYGCDAPCP